MDITSTEESLSPRNAAQDDEDADPPSNNFLFNAEDWVSAIPQPIRDAIERFESVSRTEKELARDPVLVGHMADYALARALKSIMRGDSVQHIVWKLEEAIQSLRNQRHEKHPTSTTIRIFRRDELFK